VVETLLLAEIRESALNAHRFGHHFPLSPLNPTFRVSSPLKLTHPNRESSPIDSVDYNVSTLKAIRALSAEIPHCVATSLFSIIARIDIKERNLLYILT
jgi:hypothetical protein